MGAAPTDRSQARRLRATLAAAAITTLASATLVAPAHAAPKLIDSNKAAARTASVPSSGPRAFSPATSSSPRHGPRPRDRPDRRPERLDAGAPRLVCRTGRRCADAGGLRPRRLVLRAAHDRLEGRLGDGCRRRRRRLSRRRRRPPRAVERRCCQPQLAPSSGLPPSPMAPARLVAGFFGRNEAGGITTPRGTTHRYLAVDPAWHPCSPSTTSAQPPGRPARSSHVRPAGPRATSRQIVVLRSAPARLGTPPPPRRRLPRRRPHRRPRRPPPPPPPPTPPGARDITAPSAPGNVRSTSATRTSVVVAWNASTDNVRVTGYGLYRNGAVTGTTTGTTATFTGLTCGTQLHLRRRGLRRGRQPLGPLDRERVDELLLIAASAAAPSAHRPRRLRRRRRPRLAHRRSAPWRARRLRSGDDADRHERASGSATGRSPATGRSRSRSRSTTRAPRARTAPST